MSIESEQQAILDKFEKIYASNDSDTKKQEAYTSIIEANTAEQAARLKTLEAFTVSKAADTKDSYLAAVEKAKEKPMKGVNYKVIDPVLLATIQDLTGNIGTDARGIPSLSSDTKVISDLAGKVASYATDPTSGRQDSDRKKITAQKAFKTKESEEVVLADDQTQGLIGESFINLTSQTHQCILTHYLEPVAAFHRTQLSRTGEGDGANPTNPFLARTIAPNNAADSPKIILVDDSSADSSVAPVNAVTSLGKTDVDKITPAQLAGVIPLLRLYKIYREEGIEKSKVEFKFSNKTDSGFLEKSSEQKFGEFVMDAGYAKGRSAGIRSFNWSFVGGDPFTATRDLTATLKLYFQDFRDLTEVRTDSENLFAKAGSKESNPKYKYLDLVLQPDCRDSKQETANITGSPVATGQDHDIFNPDCYEIAVEVGYVPSLDLPEGLKNQNDTLYLTMQEHSFDIGQDGTFELTIEYRARLASLLGDKGMNVLEPGGGYLVSNAYDGIPLTFDIREVEKKIKTEMKKGKDDEDYSDEDLEALKHAKGHLLHLRNNSLYRNMSNTLLKQGLIYNLPVPNDVFAKFTNFDRYDREKNQLVGLDVRNTWDIKDGDITIASCDEQVNDAGEVSTAPAAAETTEEAVVNNVEEGIVFVTLSGNPVLKDNVYFTTVGNIIAVALEHVTGDEAFLGLNPRGSIEDLVSFFKKSAKGEVEAKEGTTEAQVKEEVEGATAAQDRAGVDITEATAPSEAVKDLKIDPARKERLKRFRIILGAVTYIDAVSGSEKTINLAHLPVSMQKFREFMIDRVIAQSRSFYSFQDFIKDILTDIIFDSLNRICFGGYSAEGSAIRPGISLISGQGVKGATDADWAEPISSKTGTEIYKDRAEKTGNQSTYKTVHLGLATRLSPIFSSTKTNKAKEFNYLMFSAFSVGVLNSRLHGNRAKDADNGIAHFRYGSTKGLMKSVSFSKTPLEFAAEERYVREGTDNLLNQLAGRYEMQMSLVGNNMFIPGQYVYFDPVALGIGKSFANSDSGRSLANLMGLGGYHMVIEVGNSISPGKFETSIKALWETGGIEEKQ